MTDTCRASGGWLRQVHRLFVTGKVGDLTDGQLLDRFVAGVGEDSHAAFEELMHRHGPMVFRVCSGMLGEATSTEDAFQATFLVLAQRAGAIRRRESVSSWLFGVARRVAAHSRLCAARRRSGERLAAERTPESYLPEPWDDDRQVLLEEMERLPDRLRGVMVLCYLEGLSYDHAAQRLGLSEGAVRGRLARARDQLRARLSRRGHSFSAGFLVAATHAPIDGRLTIHVTADLVESTIRIALGITAGTAATALADGVLRSMFMSHLRAAVIVTLAAVGTCLVAWQTIAATNDDKTPPATESKPPTTTRRLSDVSSGKNKPFTALVEVRDLSTDAAIADAEIKCSYKGGTTVQAATDAQGNARVVIPDLGKSYYLKVRVSRAGFVPTVMTWSRTPESPESPVRFRFRMEQGITIGGRVLDQDQMGVAGATVVLRVLKRYANSEQRPDLSFVPTTTDGDGRWSFSGVPKKPDATEIGGYHHLCLTTDSWFHMNEFQPQSALRDGTAVLRLRRGTRIDGTVVGPDGRPAPGATVVYGAENFRTVNRIPPVKTDARGQFTLGVTPGAISVLTAQHTGFGPVIETIRVGTEPQRVTLKLQRSRTLGGRVVGHDGRPIAGATVSVRSWRGSESLEHEETTDAEGRFLWKDAPDGEVQVGIHASGYVEKRDVRLVPGAPNEFVLTSPVKVIGKVVDSETGQPVSRFSVVHGTVWNPGAQLIWQRNGALDEQTRKDPGSFEVTARFPVHQLAVRVEAEGYLPADSEPFALDVPVRELTFRLVKSGPIRGAVVNPDGSPARDGFVYLVLAGGGLDLQNDDVPEHRRPREIHTPISAGGSFTLLPQKDHWLLLALCDSGFARVPERAFSSDRTIRLRPWARVNGLVKIGTRPTAELALSLRPYDNREPAREDEPRLFRQFDFTTDAHGRFQLGRVMPGRYDVIRIVPSGVRRITFVSMASIDLAEGRSYDLTIGGRGRPVTGRLVLPANVPWMVRDAMIERKGAAGEPVRLGVNVWPDGRIQAENVEPGQYKLRIGIHEPPPDETCGWGRLVADYVREFTIAAIPGGVSDDPLDLGSLEPSPIGFQSIKVGERAPDFVVKTLDGQDLRLSDFRGKFVLVDFWATWCAPCVAEIPNLKMVHDTFAREPRFAMASLSLDDSPDRLRSFLNSHNVSWPQAFIGPDSPVADSYGATAIPATFLVGPDGRIVATDLRGEKVRATVAAALKRDHSAPRE